MKNVVKETLIRQKGTDKYKLNLPQFLEGMDAFTWLEYWILPIGFKVLLRGGENKTLTKPVEFLIALLISFNNFKYILYDFVKF